MVFPSTYNLGHQHGARRRELTIPKQSTRKPPPPRSSFVTRIKTKASTSVVQPPENQTIVPANPVLEQVNRIHEIIFVSPTRGPLTLEQLRKNNQEITSKVEQRDKVTQNLKNALSQPVPTDNSPVSTKKKTNMNMN